jgi:hypothetical protein
MIAKLQFELCPSLGNWVFKLITPKTILTKMLKLDLIYCTMFLYTLFNNHRGLPLEFPLCQVPPPQQCVSRSYFNLPGCIVSCVSSEYSSICEYLYVYRSYFPPSADRPARAECWNLRGGLLTPIRVSFPSWREGGGGGNPTCRFACNGLSKNILT